MRAESTRLRFISSPSPEGLEAVVNMLPFKVELKGISKDGDSWVAWFVLPDVITHLYFERALSIIQARMAPNLKAVANE